MFKPLELELKRLKAAGLERRLPVYASRGNGLVDISGRQVIDFTSTDYLGFSTHPRVTRAAIQTLETQGISQSPGRTGAGSAVELVSAEDRFARFLGTEAALFFSSRNQALLSALAGILSQGDQLAFDECSHAPVADAAYLLEATPLPFSLDTQDNLDAVVERSSFVPLALYAESVSPVTGEVFPFKHLASRLGVDGRFHLIVDESYALGVIGERGAGALEGSGALFPSVSYVGSFGHGLPGVGGFVAGKLSLIEYLRQTSRTIEAEPPVPAAVCAGVEQAIDVVELSIGARRALYEKVRRFRSALQNAGVSVRGADASPILSIPVQTFKGGREIVSRLLSRGFLIELAGLRGMRKELPLLRIVLSNAHSQVQIDLLSELLVESCSKKVRYS